MRSVNHQTCIWDIYIQKNYAAGWSSENERTLNSHVVKDYVT